MYPQYTDAQREISFSMLSGQLNRDQNSKLALKLERSKQREYVY